MRGRRCKRCYRRRYGHRDRGTSETHNVPPRLDTLDRVLDLRGCAPADGFAAPFSPPRDFGAPRWLIASKTTIDYEGKQARGWRQELARLRLADEHRACPLIEVDRKQTA